MYGFAVLRSLIVLYEEQMSTVDVKSDADARRGHAGLWTAPTNRCEDERDRCDWGPETFASIPHLRAKPAKKRTSF